MTRATNIEFAEYKYHNWKLCQLSLDLQFSSLSHLPLEIQVEVTTHCNIHCIMCTRPFFVTQPKHLHPDILSKLFALFPSALTVVPFGCGEPLLYPSFKEIVEHAKHCQARVIFNTNGLLLNEHLSQMFISLGVDMVTFSLDAGKEETYQAIRKGSNYSKVMDNLNTLIRLKKEFDRSTPVIGIALVPMVDNFWEIPQLLSLASKLGIRLLFFETLITPDPGWNKGYKSFYQLHNLSNLPQTELSTYLEECDALAQKLHLQIYPSNYFSSFLKRQAGSTVQEKGAPQLITSDQSRKIRSSGEDKSRSRVACTLPWTSIYVNSDGLVQTCCYSSRVFGDLKVQDVSEIWNGTEFQRYRNQIMKQEYPAECQHCLASGRNRTTMPSLPFTREQILTKQQLLSSWKGRTREILNRIYGKLRFMGVGIKD